MKPSSDASRLGAEGRCEIDFRENVQNFHKHISDAGVNWATAAGA